MGDKYDEVMRRNRRRITGLALAGLVNYWISVLLFIIAAGLGSLLVLIVQGLFEGGDFGLLWRGIKAIPGAIAWVVAAGWLSSAVMTWTVLGFLAIGTLMAISMMWGGLRKLERWCRVLGKPIRR